MNHLATLSYKFRCLRAAAPCRALLWGLCWGLLCIGMSTQAQTEATEAQSAQQQPADTSARPMIDLDQQALTLLSNELDTSDIRWLSAQGEKFLALWQPDRTGNPFGAVLILNGEGQSVDEPDEINAIRNNLSHYGWATLSVHLPPPKTHDIPPRPSPAPKTDKKDEAQDAADGTGTEESDTSSNQEEGSPATDTMQSNSDAAKQSTTDQSTAGQSAAMQKNQDHPEDLSKARINAAITFLNEQGQYNIVMVGHGVGAARAMRYIDATSSGKNAGTAKVKSRGKIQRLIRALVLVQARNHIPETDDQLTDYFSDPSLPILDLYFGDHFLDRIDTKARAKAARAARIENYYQIKILRPTETDEGSENRLTRRIRGFLNKHAKGVEVER